MQFAYMTKPILDFVPIYLTPFLNLYTSTLEIGAVCPPKRRCPPIKLYVITQKTKILIPMALYSYKDNIKFFPLIGQGSHRKRRVFYCCVCIRCRENVFTETLPSNDRGTHIQIHTDSKVIS
jgi:hypothetical protein